MKLAENVDEGKENTCNGNGISEKIVETKTVETNGEARTESENSCLDYTGLLVEGPNIIRNDDESTFQNGSKADDSVSLSSNSSNYLPHAEKNDLSDEDFISLTISEEEDHCESSKNESEATYYTSSPLPSADDKTTEEIPSGTSSISECTENKRTDSKNYLNETVTDNADRKDEKTSDSATINTTVDDIDTVSELSDEKVAEEKRDENLDILSDIDEQSKTVLQSESKDVSISDLSKEIEDIINDDTVVKKEEDNRTTDEEDEDVDKKVTNNNIDKVDTNVVVNLEKDSDESNQLIKTNDETEINVKTEVCLKSENLENTLTLEITDNQTEEQSNSEIEIKIANKKPNNQTEISETESVEDSCKSMEVDDEEDVENDFDDIVKEKDEIELKVEQIVEKNEINKIKGEDDLLREDLKGKAIKEVRTSLKRTLDTNEDSQDAKKPKINGVKKAEESKKEYVKLDCLREFMTKKEISSMTRADLEELCIQKICEVITHASQIGELNRKMSQQESVIESLRNKYLSLSKQIGDLQVVHTRVIQDIRAKTKDGVSEITPVKITRSVGLQVSLQPVVPRMRGPMVPASPPELQTAVKRKMQRNSLPNKMPNTTPNSPILMPPPQKLPNKSPQTKGIKTILPKVTHSATEQKDNSGSLLGTYLQQPSTSKITSPPIRKSAPGILNSNPGPSTASTSSNNNPHTKVIDLTDEDDIQKSISNSSGASTSGNIRVMAPQQLNNAQAVPVTTTSIPRLTYLVQGGQQGQQVLLATSTAPAGQVRPTLMFKPVPPGQVPPGQRVNIVRPTSVTVLPSTSTAGIRSSQIRFSSPVQSSRAQIRSSGPPRHPAPLPGPPAVQPSQPSWKAMPPKPTLKISRVGDGIVLSWRMQTNKDMSMYEEIASYQLYAYQETNSAPSTDMWRKVGDVKALALPMACTLTQFTDGNKYHFAVRAVDVKSRVGPFSQPEQIALP